MNNGWINCGCGTTYTDAYGNPINVDLSSGGSGNVAGVGANGGCSPNWGLLACGVIAAFVAMHMGHHKKAA